MDKKQAIDTLFNMAAKLVEESSAIAMRHYGDMGEVQFKDDKSPLTAADLEIDKYLYGQLQQAFPDIVIVTEERAETHENKLSDGMFFLVDPIDGTKEFINRRDEFTVNVALIDKQKPIAGLVAAPALGLYYLGSQDQDVKQAKELNIKTGKARPIEMIRPDNDKLKVVASRSHMTEETSAFVDNNKVGELKNAGSSLKFCLLARGEADLYPRFGPTMEWDTAAGHAVLAGAGGLVEFVDGKPFTYAKADFRNPWFIAREPRVEFKRD